LSEDRVTPLGLFHYAHSYAESASALRRSNSINATHADSPIRFLYTHAIELYLKSYLRLSEVTVNELRGRDLGHNMTALRKRAQSFGLNLNLQQEEHIDHLNDAILDRYIETGIRTVLQLETLYELCLFLHEEFGSLIYRDGKLTRSPIKLN